ncbi:tRNA-dihydrouridine(47) synthase [NAD(P)(+)] [Clohesyomyces aquaticus]|uniref:tRNA-dihydrouridine(47) synthase [NAD(P)(+)] n=1 Tax=Clohesyomyces aquaticus TaxID=1231657 RepID=A0A1Y1ZVA3_9PLEO|nr:tRNA-dihydrouridine(47) synthase [NAD(P)(+)] [Clohesyomyces aquaticus]
MADEAVNAGSAPEPVQRELYSNIDKIEPDGRIENQGNGTDIAGSTKRKINEEDAPATVSKRQKGVASIKAEYLVQPTGNRGVARRGAEGDDEAEGADDRYRGDRNSRDNRQGQGGKGNKRDKKNNKQKGQNTSRTFGSSYDKIQLCNTRALYPEFSPKECPFGDRCRMEHDLRKYLEKGKREDLTTFGGKCPVYESRGVCTLGWKCRFAGSHSEERETEDGRKELVLTEDAERKAAAEISTAAEDEVGVVNVVPKEAKINLSKRKTGTPRSDAYLQWVNANSDDLRSRFDNKKKLAIGKEDTEKEDKDDNRAQYTEPPFLPSEKRRLYYGPETPVLAPLTTQGNLPFRRLCVELGAQVTWSEMAMGLPLIQGEKGEWALMKAHESEIRPPTFLQKNTVVQGYDNTKDLKFGVQIAANKPWLACKTVEVLTALCPSIRAIDLNCGCPINLVCEQGSGSALLDNGGKLENILRGMNYVSNETPITVKIRMGTKDNQPTAQKLVKRLVLGGYEAIEAGKGTSGVAAITLHGRSKQQRYTRSADWGYIADCAALINRLKRERSVQTDTIREADPRDLANDGHVYFVGNGDCYSHVDYFSHLENAKVDSVMVARGALIKPWIFEEISAGQYLDKSATERLSYVEKFAKYGLQTWGSDEMGIGTTRRFLLEWLSFACRYVPVGLLEHLPPNIQDRAPAFKGRDELETLMSSENYKDWIKISEMFLGPAHPNFRFEPKHKSNAYEIEAEG